MTSLQVGQHLTVEIKSTGINGEGIAYFEKAAIFIAKSLPEEVIDIMITLVRDNYAFAEIVTIQKPSIYRRDSICPDFDTCSGCQFINCKYSYARYLKLTNFKQCLLKFYKGFNINLIKDYTYEEDGEFNYRNKAMLNFFYDGVKLVIGLNRERTNLVSGITECHLHSKSINNVLISIVNYFNELFESKKLSSDLARNFQNITLKISNINKEILVMIGFNKYHNDLIKAWTDYTYNGDNIVLKSYCMTYKEALPLWERDIMFLNGNHYLEIKVLDNIFQLGLLCFGQINYYISTKIYQKVCDIVKEIKPKNVVEGYAGIGVMSISIAKLVEKVTAIEINRNSTYYFVKNLEKNNIDNVKVLKGDFGEEYAKLPSEDIDLLIVNPSRLGLEKAVGDILKKTSKYLIYISCNPSSLSRDLFDIKNTYKIKYLELYEMMPQTSHTESLVFLERIDK